MENSEDNSNVEEAVNKFVEWLLHGKLEIKAYPSENIHAKIYIMTFVDCFPHYPGAGRHTAIHMENGKFPAKREAT